MAVFLFLGPTKAIEIKAWVTVPLRFLFIIIFAIVFGGLNSSVKGSGMGWYLGGELFPLPDNGTGVTEYRAYTSV